MLDLHANVFPADLSLQQVCHRAAVWLATLPPEHLLANLYWHKAVHQVALLPLHDLAFIFSISPDSVEKMPLARTPPRRQAKFRVALPQTAKESIEWDLRNTAQTRIYTDGLGFNGLAGAAAVLFRGQAAPRMLWYHLGLLTEHTTFEVEALGVILGLHLLGSERQVTSVTISTDSQAVLGALDTRNLKPGQQYIDEILRLAIGAWCWAMPGDYSLELAWVKGHDGSEGNKQADLETKAAAGGSSSPVKELPNFLSEGSPHTSASALRQEHQKGLGLLWKEQWKASLRHPKLAKINPSLLSKFFQKLVANLARTQASLLTQFCIRHIPLNTYLHLITKIDSPQCTHFNSAGETTHHFLFNCPAWLHECWLMGQALGRDTKSLRHILNSKHGAGELMKFVGRTGWLKASHSDVPFSDH